MKPAPFRYERPETMEEALDLLARHGFDAKPLAGGQSLVPTMNFRLAQPAVLIDLNRIPELTGIRTAGDGEGESEGGVRIEAMTRQRQAERSELVAVRAPLLAEALPWIAHPQIRNRGTVGGTLAHADPAAELPAVMVACGARFLLRGTQAQRWVPASEFYVGLFTTLLEPDELLVAVEIPPLPEGAGWAFEEVARRHGDYALVGVAAHLAVGADGRCGACRIALLSVGDGPVTPEACGKLVGEELTSGTIAAVAGAVAREIDPPSDIHASAAYRRQLARVLTRRALVRAAGRARGDAGAADSPGDGP